MRLFLFLLIVLLPLQAKAQIAVVEMFTTSACAPCHPADALLSTLQKENESKDFIALSCHIPGMGDASVAQNLALDLCKERQSFYYSNETINTASTPNAVINGLHQLSGSNEKLMRSGLAMAYSTNTIKPVTLTKTESEIEIVLPAMDLLEAADIWVFSYVPQTEAELKDGTILNYAGLIKDVQKISEWDGQATTLKIKTEKLPANGFAVLAQKFSGEILAAGKLEF